MLLHQFAQVALAHDGVGHVQAGKLALLREFLAEQVPDDPIVQRAVVLKLQAAQAEGDALDGVLDGMGEVVHRVDAPLVALAVMGHMLDAVDGRVAHVHVRAGRVDLGPQGHGPVGELAGAHPGEEIQGLLDGPVAEGGASGGVHVAAVLLKLLGGQLAHVGQALFDELHGVLVHLLKVVGGEEKAVAPVVAQPVDILLDGLHVLHVLLGGVGVVHAQVAQAAVFLGGAEVHEDRLGMADVQIAVGLRREPGVDGHALELTTLGDVLVNEIMDEVLRHGGFQLFWHVNHSSFLIRTLILP